jgi:hypothetical protein
LVTPARCHKCQEKVITKAYRALCNTCARPDKLCTKCEQPVEGGVYAEYKLPDKVEQKMQEDLEEEMDAVLQKLRERCKKTILRKIETGEIAYDKAKKAFIYKDTDEEYKL